MKNIYYINNRTFLICIFLLLFSLSCDETEPISAENEALTYSITIQSEVKNCHLLNCDVDSVAYAYNVDNPQEDDYYLYFKIELLDHDEDPVVGVSLNVQECPILEDGTSSTCETTSQFAYFDGGSNTTDSQGMLEGYWNDNGEAGSFLVTFEYVDDSENETTENHQITINSISDFITMNVWSNTQEEVIDNTNVTYQTTLSAQVLNEYNSSMPNIPILFNLITDGVGSLDNAFAYTSETGEPATVIYTIEPSTLEGITSDNVQVSFDVSVFNEGINEIYNITYPVNGGLEPEYDISEFHFYPNYTSLPHNQYDQTEVSVIAKNDAGVGISNVLVRFSLEEEPDGTSRPSNGEISHEFQYTCCESSSADSTESSVAQNGVASITYTNIQGGNDILTAYILDPFTSEILTDEDGNQIGLDIITIINNEACPNCDEELRLITSNYLLPDEGGLESTDIYAFYTDSLGNPPEINSYITFSALQPDPEDNGEWIDVGSLNPQHSLFITVQAGDLDDELFEAFPADSTLVYATTRFNMETAAGLVKVVGVYEGLTDTLGIQISSAAAHSISVIPPYPSVISVQGSPTDESTVLEANITDGMGNNVTEPYLTRWTLTNETILGGVHLSGDEDLTDAYSISTLGLVNITVNSGHVPVSVAMNLEVHPYSVIENIDEAGDLDALDTNDDDDDGLTDDRLYEPICTAYTVPLTVASGPATNGVIGYSFSESENIGGGLSVIPVSIMLWDTWSNPVVDSTSVYFTLEPETTGEIGPEAKTNGLKPPYDNENAHWPGVAWTTITYNTDQLHEVPEIKGYTTGSFCADSTSSYEECDDLGLEWLTSQQIIVSSFANDVPYENVCVDCSLTLLPLSDTQVDWACPTNPNPNTDIFEVYLRANLTDFYLVPVEGSNVELIYSGTQGGPTIEAIQYLCYFDSNPENGEYDDGEEQTLDGVPLTQEQCDVVPAFTWGPAYFIEPPSDQVLTDNDGNKYWRVTFNHNECTETQADPLQYSCTSPTMLANLVNPNGATSEEVSVTILSTCSE